MDREDARNLKLFQIVRWNCKVENVEDDADRKWLIPYCGKLAIVTQNIIWPDYGEEIHLQFPEKKFNQHIFYDDVAELMHDYEIGHNISLNIGFDTDADCIDLVDY